MSKDTVDPPLLTDFFFLVGDALSPLAFREWTEIRDGEEVEMYDIRWQWAYELWVRVVGFGYEISRTDV